MSRVRLPVPACLILLAACTKSAPHDGAASSRPPVLPATASSSPPAASVASAPSASAVAAGEQELLFASNGVRVRAWPKPPPRWTENRRENGITYQSPAWHSSMLVIELACQGSCGDAGTLAKNLARDAREAFAFTRGKDHVPQLQPAWVHRTSEEGPGVFYTRFDAVSAADAADQQQEHHVWVDRVLAGTDMLLLCRAEVTELDPGWADRLEQACLSLRFELLSP